MEKVGPIAGVRWSAQEGLPASSILSAGGLLRQSRPVYESSGLPSPLGVKAHSTRGVAASKAFSAGVPVFGHLQRCGLVHPVHLCPVLRPRHRYYPRFLRFSRPSRLC